MRRRILFGILIALVLVGGLYHFGRRLWEPGYFHLTGRRTVADVVEKFEPAAEARLALHFKRTGVSYPPARVALIAFKEEKRLELWAAGAAEPEDAWRFVRAYPVLGASGEVGPKLRRGDHQVPEGTYRVEGLNPNSRFHLSIKLDYPNTFDRARAAENGRTDLGGDIFIHGRTASIGCLAMGDEAIEELFVLVARVSKKDVKVLIAPCDLRARPAPALEEAPSWADRLYDVLGRELEAFPVPEKDRSDGEAP